MSDCRYGVSPVNYPDPDPDLSRTYYIHGIWDIAGIWDIPQPITESRNFHRFSGIFVTDSYRTLFYINFKDMFV